MLRIALAVLSIATSSFGAKILDGKVSMMSSFSNVFGDTIGLAAVFKNRTHAIGQLAHSATFVTIDLSNGNMWKTFGAAANPITFGLYFDTLPSGDIVAQDFDVRGTYYVLNVTSRAVRTVTYPTLYSPRFKIHPSGQYIVRGADEYPNGMVAFYKQNITTGVILGLMARCSSGPYTYQDRDSAYFFTEEGTKMYNLRGVVSLQVYELDIVQGSCSLLPIGSDYSYFGGISSDNAYLFFSTSYGLDFPQVMAENIATGNRVVLQGSIGVPNVQSTMTYTWMGSNRYALVGYYAVYNMTLTLECNNATEFGPACTPCPTSACDVGQYRGACAASSGACTACTNPIPANALYITAGDPYNANNCSWGCGAGSFRSGSGCAPCKVCSAQATAAGSCAAAGSVADVTCTCNAGFVGDGTTCVPPYASSDPLDVAMRGMSVERVAYNATNGYAWEVDLVYPAPPPNALVAIYLPRVDRAGDGAYSAAFNQTFKARGFPCSPNDPSSRAATTCCLADVAARYHVFPAFPTPSAGCAATTPPPLTAGEAVTGALGADMPGSYAVALPPSADGARRVRLVLAHADLRQSASQLRGLAGADEQLDLFVGAAYFAPTGTRILDSSVAQVQLSVRRTNYFTLSSTGTDDQTFLSYVSLVAREVLDAASASGARAQYLTVRFAVKDQYAPNAATGLVPPTSVLVGKAGSAPAWAPACSSPVSADFARVASQACGPGLAFCDAAGGAAALQDRFASVHVPLPSGANGTGFFDVTAARDGVQVQLVVSVTDPSGKPAATTLRASVPVAVGGVSSWCAAGGASAGLEAIVDGASLVVGVAGSAADLARLPVVTGLQRPDAAGAASGGVNASSAESGLLTLVLQGSSGFFGAAGNTALSLELQDVYTLHVVGDSALADVQAAVAAPGGAFRVVLDQVRNTASLVPSAAITAACKAAPNPLPQSSCVLRADVQARQHVKGTTLELTSAPVANRSAFMQQLMGPSSFAATLGANFSQALASKYQLDGRARRAYWINPGYTWLGTTPIGTAAFQLSQRIWVFALVQLSSPFDLSVRRRALLAVSQGVTPASAASGASASVGYPVDTAMLMEKRMGLPPGCAVRLQVVFSAPAADACAASSPPPDAAGKAGLLQAAVMRLDGAVGFWMTASAVDRSACVSVRRAASVSASVDLKLDLLVMFSTVATPSVQAAVAAAARNVDGVRTASVTPPPSGSPASLAVPTATASASPTDGGAPAVTIGAAVAIGAGVAATVLVAAAVAAVWMTRRGRGAARERKAEPQPIIIAPDFESGELSRCRRRSASLDASEMDCRRVVRDESVRACV